MKKTWIIRGVTALIIIVLLYLFPLFHVNSLSEKVEKEVAGSFDATKVVEKSWNGSLKTAAAEALPFDEIIQAIKNDKEAAFTTFGNAVGVGSKRHFMARAEGVVQTIDDKTMVVVFDTLPDVTLQVRKGPVFGNTVRDGCGLFEVSDYSDSRQFNDIAAALNKKIEVGVVPLLFSQLKGGENVSLVGCFTIDAKKTTLETVKFIPIQFEIL